MVLVFVTCGGLSHLRVFTQYFKFGAVVCLVHCLDWLTKLLASHQRQTLKKRCFLHACPPLMHQHLSPFVCLPWLERWLHLRLFRSQYACYHAGLGLEYRARETVSLTSAIARNWVEQDRPCIGCHVCKDECVHCKDASAAKQRGHAALRIV